MRLRGRERGRELLVVVRGVGPGIGGVIEKGDWRLLGQ